MAMERIAGLESICWTVIIVSGCMLLVALVSGGLRIYVRTRLLRFFGADDWAMLAALVLFTASCISICLMAASLNSYNQGVSTCSYANFIKLAKAGFCMYLATVISVKISIASFMWRIYGPFHPKERAAVVFFTIIPLLFGVTLIIMTISTCAYRYVNLDDSACLSTYYFGIINQVFSISSCISNWYFVGQAIYILWNMTMTRAARITAILLFGVGATGDVASVMRIVSFYLGPNDTVRKLRYTQWSVIEAGACATAACLFTLRPLLSKGFANRRGDRPYVPDAGPPVFMSMPTIDEGNVAALRTHGLTVEKKEVRQDSFVFIKKRAGSIFTFLSFPLASPVEAENEA